MASVSFEISYAGSVQLGLGNVGFINLHFEGVRRKFFACVNNTLSTLGEQLLKIKTMSVSGDSAQEMLDEHVYDRITVELDRAKTLSLSTNVFQGVNDLAQEMQYLRSDIVRINSPVFPEFEAEKCYRIKVQKAENALEAAVVLVDAEVAEVESQQQIQREIEAESQMREFDRLFGSVSGADKALQSLQALTISLVQESAMNPQWDALGIDELRTRYEAAREELELAKQALISAEMESDMSKIIQAILTGNEKAQKIIELANALERKCAAI